MAKIYELKTWLHDAAGHFFQNVFHYIVNEVGGLSPFVYAKKLIDAWDANNTADYLALLGSDVVLDFFTARKINDGGGPTATKFDGSPGSSASACVSAGFCADIVWVNNSGNHRFGHTFIGGIPDGTVLGDEYQPGFQALADAWIADMLQQLTLAVGAGTADFCTYTRKTDVGSPNTDGELRVKVTLLNKRTTPVL